MKNFTFLLLSVLLISCNSTRKVEKALLTGDYSRAIDLALNQIQKGRDNNKTEEQKVILQKAFEKYQDAQLDKVKFLIETMPSSEEEIYYAYNDLYNIQKDIEPVLPLFHQGKKLKFKFENINADLFEAKQNYAEALYQSGVAFMANNDVMSYRAAYDVFNNLIYLIPNYKDVPQLMFQSKALGIDHVLVKMYNDSEIAIPKRLEEEILNFNTYGLDDIWTVYHASPTEDMSYNYNIDLRFQTIIFSPERIVKREVPVTSQIEVTETQRDRDGNILRDDDGNPLTYTRTENVEAVLYTVSQEKLVSLIAQVSCFLNSTGEKIDDYELDSQFLFTNNFATFDGDKRALSDEQLVLIGGKAVSFPTNEQMLFDAAEDVKNKFKDILKRHNLN